MSIKKNSAGKKDDIPVFLKKVSIVQSELDDFLCVGVHELCSAVLARRTTDERGVAYRLVYIYSLRCYALV